MSWIPATLIFVVLSLIIALVVTEWIVRRRRTPRDGDQDSLV